MAGELVIVIVPAAVADVARDQMENKDTVVFADAEVLRALEAISTRRPGKVLLERRFAKTSRGSGARQSASRRSVARAGPDRHHRLHAGPAAAPRDRGMPSVTVVDDPHRAPAAPPPAPPAPAPGPVAAPPAAATRAPPAPAARQVGHATRAARERRRWPECHCGWRDGEPRGSCRSSARRSSRLPCSSRISACASA